MYIHTLLVKERGCLRQTILKTNLPRHIHFLILHIHSFLPSCLNFVDIYASPAYFTVPHGRIYDNVSIRLLGNKFIKIRVSCKHLLPPYTVPKEQHKSKKL